MSSIFVQLSSYLLLEYIYGDNSTTYLSSQVKLARIKNAYLENQCQLLNGSASLNITQNVLNTSAANLGGFKWVLLNNDVPVPYISTDNKLTYTDLSSLLPSLYVTYDTVRVHILSGYRLENLEGLIIQIYGKEALTSKISVLANNVYLNSDDRDTLNPRPILMGDRMYDRYIEVLVPSIKEINQDFFANPTNPFSIGYQFTSNNSGLLFNTAIYVKAYEINRTEKKSGNLFLYTSDSYEINVNQEDRYSALSAKVQESSDGDYFMYYPTYDGNFIEDFIADLNAEGGDYVLINNIDVYEQVGLDNILTFSFSQIQTEGYNGPLEFRPILKYAGSAVSFSVDYTVRVYNRSNGFQIIRRASTTSFNVRKYGKQLDKIALAKQSFPFKVYNKVYGNSPVTFIGNEYSSNFSTVYVPVFYEARNIVVQSKTLLANGSNPVSPDFYNQINFGQGDARIYLSDFESYFKFVISQVDSKTGAVSPLDLTAGDVVISFKDSIGNILKFSAEPSSSENSLSNGEVVFKIPGNVKSKVLTSDAVHPFYILTEASGAPETLIYTGTVDKIENISKETARAKEVVTISQSSSTTSTTGGTASSAASTTTDTVVQSNQKSLLQTLTDSNSAAVNSVKSTPEVKPPVIPNFNYDQGAASIKMSLTPVSEEATVESQNKVISNLSQSSGTTTNI